MIIWALLGGLTYRIRGGFLDDIIGMEINNFWNRSVWALYVTVAMYQVIPNIKMIPLIFAMAFLGCILGYWKAQFNLGDDINNVTNNWKILTLRGMFIIFPVALVSLPFNTSNPWFGVMAGALFVPCYLMGNIIYKYCKWQGWTQWGEWLIGSCIGAALALPLVVESVKIATT